MLVFEAYRVHCVTPGLIALGCSFLLGAEQGIALPRSYSVRRSKKNDDLPQFVSLVQRNQKAGQKRGRAEEGYLAYPPKHKKKCFVSSTLTMDEKLEQAKKYVQECRQV